MGTSRGIMGQLGADAPYMVPVPMPGYWEKKGYPQEDMGTSHEYMGGYGQGTSQGNMGSQNPRLVYLAGPFRPYTDSAGRRHTIAENIREAGRLGLEIWKRGFVAVVPHTMTYLVPKSQRQDGGISGVAPEVFLEGELELLRRCDLLVLMPTWRVSKGALAEKEYAEIHGIPVLEWDEFLAGGAQ